MVQESLHLQAILLDNQVTKFVKATKILSDKVFTIEYRIREYLVCLQNALYLSKPR